MIIPDGKAQANLIFTGAALPTHAEVTFGIDVSSFAGEPADAAAQIATDWSSAGMDAAYVGDVTLNEVRVKFGPNDTGPFGSVFPGIDGSAANPAVPANTSLLVNKQTAMGGRVGRGRFYLPGVPSNQIDADGQVHSGFLGTIAGHLSDFLSKLGTDDLAMVLLHGESHATLGTALVLQLIPQNKLATQRRRLRA